VNERALYFPGNEWAPCSMQVKLGGLGRFVLLAYTCQIMETECGAVYQLLPNIYLTACPANFRFYASLWAPITLV